MSKLCSDLEISHFRIQTDAYKEVWNKIPRRITVIFKNQKDRLRNI